MFSVRLSQQRGKVPRLSEQIPETAGTVVGQTGIEEVALLVPNAGNEPHQSRALGMSVRKLG